MLSVSVAEAEPPELFAQIVNESDAEVKFTGVPQTLPFVVPKVRPVGKDGEISHEVIAPPEVVGVMVDKSRLLEISTGVE